MARGFQDGLDWMRHGTKVLLNVIELGEFDYAADTPLPGWTRKHVAAHVAANAEALGNLLRWAATGERTPMYASPEERAAGIEAGTRLPDTELTAWLCSSAERLDAAMADLEPADWAAKVVTAQGRTVAATEIPWMRAREVWVHAVDLSSGLALGVTFADLPAGYLAALCDDAVAKRSAGSGPALLLVATDVDRSWELPGDGSATRISGPLAEVAAYLTGRPCGFSHAPALGPWL
ncbi:maleylpyruvate isomerase family mycothiol-dependent enzyme [Nocardia sp. CA-084685]|uniref:maleylpyruvate isomerase family mycothiol-dependent enzyme n=1 Tax=Nocardia sp. CA-084685 TaxID=3239970 RepID=UPI003D977E7D